MKTNKCIKCNSTDIYYSDKEYHTTLCEKCYIKLVGEPHKEIWVDNPHAYCKVHGLRYPFIAYLMKIGDEVFTGIPKTHLIDAHTMAHINMNNPHRIDNSKISVLSVVMTGNNSYKKFKSYGLKKVL